MENLDKEGILRILHQESQLWMKYIQSSYNSEIKIGHLRVELNSWRTRTSILLNRILDNKKVAMGKFKIRKILNQIGHISMHLQSLRVVCQIKFLKMRLSLSNRFKTTEELWETKKTQETAPLTISLNSSLQDICHFSTTMAINLKELTKSERIHQ